MIPKKNPSRSGYLARSDDEDLEKELFYVEVNGLLQLENSYRNFKMILLKKIWWTEPSNNPRSEYHNTTGGRLCFNDMTQEVCILVEKLVEDSEHEKGHKLAYTQYNQPAFNEEWFSFTCDCIGKLWKINPDHSELRTAILHASFERPFHPVRKYLRDLMWDGLPRLHYLASDFLRMPNPTLLQRRLVALWMISAVARAMQPGCKVDTVLVLHGEQGLFKSSFFRILGGEWFSDSAMDLSNKDCYLQLAHSWVYEWAEIGKITRLRNAEEIKAFIASSHDLFRGLYEKTARRRPRSMVFCGTTNQQEFLVDPTGNRRFWVLHVTQKIDLALLTEHRDQLWAEAVAAYDENPVDGWCLNSFEELDLEASLQDYTVHDDWEGLLKTYMDQCQNTGKAPTLVEIMTSAALGLERKELAMPTQHRVGELLRKLGYRSEKQSASDRTRVWRSKKT